MPKLPNPLTITNASGSQFNQAYQLLNDDNTLMAIAGKTFEFVLRTDPGQTGATTPIAAINSTTTTVNGTIAVNVATSTLLVTLNGTATATLAQGQYHYALWMDPGLGDATALIEGTWFAQQTAAP